MSASSGWFAVDKQGLAKLVERKGKAFVLHELIQNAWDTKATFVNVVLTPLEGRPYATLFIEDDDPNGFSNLDHAFTLFAESEKKSDATKRGRFNLGEKLVLSLCERAEIISTKGSVYFTDTGRSTSKKKLEKGSAFLGVIRMTRAEFNEVCQAAKMLLPPSGIATTFNDEPLLPRIPLKTFEVTLPTEVADDEGYLRRSARKTEVRVYTRQGESSRLYEMGIPVVEIEDPWDIEIMQKIPLNSERDNVTPAYLRELRVNVLNAMHRELLKEDVSKSAIQEAIADDRVIPEAIETVLTQQYGTKRAVFDPSDPEANHRLVSQGYTIIPGGAFTKEAWKNIKEAGAALPSGKISPTPKPYSKDPEAKEARFVHRDKWTVGMTKMASYIGELGTHLLGTYVNVEYEVGRMTDGWAANYSHGVLIFNHDRLGKSWFDQPPSEKVNDLIIHEFGHHYAGNHLSEDYYDALTMLGAKLWKLAMTDPGFFKGFGAS